MVIVYVKFFGIDLRDPGLKWALLELQLLSVPSLYCLHEHLHEFSE